MALEDIKQKILSEAKTKAEKIIAEAEKIAAEKLAAAQKILRREQKSAQEQLDKDRAQALQQRRQLLALEGEQSALALKRDYLRQALDLAVERLTQKKLPEFYAKIFKEIDFTGAQILAGGDISPVETACRSLGVKPKIIPQKDWPTGRLIVDYGRSRLDCSLQLFAQEQASASEAELAEKLWS